MEIATGNGENYHCRHIFLHAADEPYFWRRYGTIMLQGSGEKALTVDSGVTIKAEANQYCISVTGAADQKVNQATVTLNECKLDSKGSGIAVNGYITEGTEPKIILNGASITAQDHGIYLAGKATTNIEGGEITGNVGVEIRNGALNEIGRAHV